MLQYFKPPREGNSTPSEKVDGKATQWPTHPRNISPMDAGKRSSVLIAIGMRLPVYVLEMDKERGFIKSFKDTLNRRNKLSGI